MVVSTGMGDIFQESLVAPVPQGWTGLGWAVALGSQKPKYFQVELQGTGC